MVSATPQNAINEVAATPARRQPRSTIPCHTRIRVLQASPWYGYLGYVRIAALTVAVTPAGITQPHLPLLALEANTHRLSNMNI